MAANNGNKKELLKVTRRDAIILSLLLVLLEGYLLYAYLLVPSIESSDELARMLQMKTNQMSIMKRDYDQMEAFRQESATASEKFTVLEKRIPAYLSEEEMLLTLSEHAGETVLIENVAFLIGDAESAVPYATLSRDASPTDSSAASGTAGSTAATGNTTAGTSEADVDLSAGTVRHMEFTVTVSGSYGEIRRFLQEIEQNERLIRVTGAAFTATDGMINAVFAMRTVAFTDELSAGAYQLDAQVTRERDNPFRPFNGFTNGPIDAAAATDAKALESSWYMILNSHLDNAPKVSMGLYSDPASDISVNVNAQTSASLHISGTADEMTSVLKVGDKSYSTIGPVTAANGEIQLKVISEARASEKDLVDVTLDVTNETDLRLTILVVNEDPDRPRFSLGKVAGSVTQMRD